MEMEPKNEDRKIMTILELPLYTLRILLGFLDATSLFQLAQTCTYMKECIEDPLFWKYIDARRTPDSQLKLTYCTNRSHEKTTHILFGAKQGIARIPTFFFNKINSYQFLKVLAIEYQTLTGFGITLKDFPSQLEELSLKGTILRQRDSVSFFQHSASNMTKLRVLVLDNCNWLTCSFLISVAKYENLEIISVVNCSRIHLHTVPYLNVAKYGLKKLKIFDARFTGIAGEIINTFYSKESIQKFYFQSFNCAQVDYTIVFNKNSNQCPSDNFTDLQLSDTTLSQYNGVTVLPSEIQENCDSILYKDPYPNCTCGHRDYHEDGPIVDHDIPEDRVPVAHVTKFICDKHLKDMKCVPSSLREFCLAIPPSQVELRSPGLADDDESSDDDVSCCTVGSTSKMVILQNLSGPATRREVVIPSPSLSTNADRQMNIFIVNPLEALGNQGNQQNAEPMEGGERAENLANENRENDNRPEGEGLPNRMHGRENENESRDSKTNKTQPLTNTSKGVLENYMNENSENSRIEVERLENEMSHENRETISGSSNAQTSKGCDDDMSSNNADQPIDLTKAKSNGMTSSNRKRKIENISSDSGDYSPGTKYQHMENDQSLPSTSKDASTSTRGSGQPTSNSQNPEANCNRGQQLPQRQFLGVFIGAEAGQSRGFNQVVTEGFFRAGAVQLNRLTSQQRLLRVRQFRPFLPQGGPRLRYRFPKNEHKLSLRCLSLRGYRRITDNTLFFIKHLNLELLDLTYTSVTKTGIENYLMNNPNCRIIHKNYCICKPVNPF